MGAACLAFFHAQLKPGIETVLEIIGFDKLIVEAGFLATFSILPYPVTLEQAMQKDFTLCNIANTTEQIMRIIKNQTQ